MKPDQTRVEALLIDTVSLLCRNGLNFATDIKVQGLLGITIDEKDVFLVHFNEILSDKPSDKSELVEIEASVEPPAVTVSPSILDDENHVVDKLDARITGFSSSTESHRQYVNLPHSFQMRRRVRRFGQHLRNRQMVSKIDFYQADADEDEKLDVPYSDVKTEAEENVLPNVSEEQDDVIVLESEDGLFEHTQDVDSYVKEEESSEVYDQDSRPTYSYANPYVHMNSSGSEMLNCKEAEIQQGTFSNVSYSSHCDDDVKPDFQLQSSSEIWTEHDTDWQSTESDHIAGSDYGQRSMCLPSRISNSNHGTTHMQRKCTRVTASAMMNTPTTFRNLQHGMTTALYKEPFLPTNQTLISTKMSSHQHLRQTRNPQGDGWAANAGTITSFVCKLCGKTMGHRRSLLRHQITAHGRIKQKRGRPPVFSSL